MNPLNKGNSPRKMSERSALEKNVLAAVIYAVRKEREGAKVLLATCGDPTIPCLRLFDLRVPKLPKSLGR